MTAARVIVTADSPAWATIAAQTMTGYATSVIACDAEAGIERELAPEETPDGRPGVSVLVFAFSRDALEKAIANRVGQCVMTCPTTACYNGLPLGEKDDQRRRQAPLLRRRLADLQADRRPAVLAHSGNGRRVPLRGDLRHGQGRRRRQYHRDGIRARRDARSHRSRPSPRCAAAADVILPFPGGIARSGSKVGSKYKSFAPAPIRPSRRRSAASCRPRCRRALAAPTRS